MEDRRKVLFTDGIDVNLSIFDYVINVMFWNLPVGVNITGNCFDDQNVLNIAYALENVMPYKNQIAKEVNNG